MSFGEKRAWIYGVIALAVPLVYFATIAGQLAHTDVGRIAYVRPLLIAVTAGVVLNMVATMVAASSPRDRDKRDERDRQITRLGEYVAFYVVSAGAAVPLGLAMAKAPYFWIANALYLAFVLAALVSSVVKIVAYRRGF